MSFQIILCTCPDKAIAEHIAHTLLTEQFAACVNIIPQLTSIYQWQDKIETANEYLLLIKTSAKHYQQIENTIKAEHPYQVPEIIAVDISQGLPAYLQWIAESVKA